MNVLCVITTLHKGGAEAHLLLLAESLRAHGVTCEVAFLRAGVAGGSIDLRDSFERAGIRTHYLASEQSCDPRAGIRLRQLVAARTWDIIHSHLPRADGAAAFCKLLNHRQIWISTIHHPYDNAYSAAPLIPFLAPMWRRADGIIAVSESVRQWAIRRLGVPEHRVRTIVHGVDLHHKSIAAPSPSVQQTGHCIGSIGRLEERKGHETLIRAMPSILKEFPDAQLKIAGHDPWGHGKVLRKLIAELALEPQVRLVGFMSDQDAFFSDVDVFAFASRAEGFGIVLLEAMAAGKAVVVSDIAPLNQIVCPGKSGLVAKLDDAADFADAIISLFRDPGYLRRVGDEGRRRVATEFSQAQMVTRTVEYYREVMTREATAR